MATVDLDTLFRTRTVVVEERRRASHDTSSNRLPTSADKPDHAHHYPRAFHQWMTELSSSNTRRAYTRAWSDLLRHAGKHPWEITCSDLRDWVDDLSKRPCGKKTGYSSATINQYIAAVSSFYRFAIERCPIVTGDGRERPLHTGPNPALAVQRPNNTGFRRANYLDADALTAILAVIPRHTVQGLRDLALFLGYILTGRRNTEWRCLRWGDITHHNTAIHHTWNGKGKESQRHELAPPVWDAIRNYLRAAGRLNNIQPGDYVFVPLNDRAAHLPNVPSDEWTRSRPLSLGHVNRLLKKYARRAGLDPANVTVHTLRHSFAMLLDSLGVDVNTISKRLGHSNLNTTTIYLDHIKGVPDSTWRQAAATLKLDLFQ